MRQVPLGVVWHEANGRDEAMKRMNRRVFLKQALLGAAAFCTVAGSPARQSASADPLERKFYVPVVGAGLQPAQLNPAPLVQPVRLVFVHHSTGENWLMDENGGLGLALRDNGYFVSDTHYGWGPHVDELGGEIGTYTDIGHWYNWFLGPQRDLIMSSLYTHGDSWCGYSRLEAAPAGENQIILFKSCFPNSMVGGSPTDPPTVGDNLLQGQDAGSGELTVGNIKRLYNDLLGYFGAHPEKLFVVVTAPPLASADTNATAAANARAVNRWLVESWLLGYPRNNVAVYDFYNVLTSNAGDADHNDLNGLSGNHHRLRMGVVEHPTNRGGDISAYPSGDSHPSQAGNQKATGEFIPLLNGFYHRWSGS